MEIVDSLEMRWFIDDVRSATAKAARAWFASASAEPPREDRYLLTGRDDLGVKTRGGRGREPKLETKFRLGALPAVTVNGRLVGDVERWRKLSVVHRDADVTKSGTWLRVVKRRRMHRYSAAALELAELVVGKRRTLTIGLEGTADVGAFMRVAAEAFASAPRGLALSIDQAASYPRWLERTAPYQ